MKILRTASIRFNFTGSYKKECIHKILCHQKSTIKLFAKIANAEAAVRDVLCKSCS